MLRSKAIALSSCSPLLLEEGLHIRDLHTFWFIAPGKFEDINSVKVAAKITTEATRLDDRLGKQW